MHSQHINNKAASKNGRKTFNFNFNSDNTSNNNNCRANSSNNWRANNNNNNKQSIITNNNQPSSHTKQAKATLPLEELQLHLDDLNHFFNQDFTYHNITGLNDFSSSLHNLAKTPVSQRFNQDKSYNRKLHSFKIGLYILHARYHKLLFDKNLQEHHFKKAQDNATSAFTQFEGLIKNSDGKIESTVLTDLTFAHDLIKNNTESTKYSALLEKAKEMCIHHNILELKQSTDLEPAEILNQSSGKMADNASSNSDSGIEEMNGDDIFDPDQVYNKETAYLSFLVKKLNAMDNLLELTLKTMKHTLTNTAHSESTQPYLDINNKFDLLVILHKLTNTVHSEPTQTYLDIKNKIDLLVDQVFQYCLCSKEYFFNVYDYEKKYIVELDIIDDLFFFIDRIEDKLTALQEILSLEKSLPTHVIGYQRKSQVLIHPNQAVIEFRNNDSCFFIRTNHKNFIKKHLLENPEIISQNNQPLFTFSMFNPVNVKEDCSPEKISLRM